MKTATLFEKKENKQSTSSYLEIDLDDLEFYKKFIETSGVDISTQDSSDSKYSEANLFPPQMSACIGVGVGFLAAGTLGLPLTVSAVSGGVIGLAVGISTYDCENPHNRYMDDHEWCALFG